MWLIQDVHIVTGISDSSKFMESEHARCFSLAKAFRPYLECYLDDVACMGHKLVYKQ